MVARAQVTILTGNQVLNVGAQSYNEVDAYDNSQVNVLGGGSNPPTYNVNLIYSYNNAAVTMSGGVTQEIISLNQSTVSITGGKLTSALVVDDQSTANITGGSLQFLDVEEGLGATVSGGSVFRLISGNGDATVTGGSFTSLETLVNGNVTMYGSNFSVLSSTPGVVSNSAFTYTGAFFTVSGTLEGNTAAATYTLFDSAYQTNLSNGAVVSTNGGFILDDLQSGHVLTVNANAPEPSALAFALLAVPSVAIFARSRR